MNKRILTIFKQFRETFYDEMQVMHPYPAPYHMEGSVWTHTMMVFNKALDTNDTVLIVTALLHDIGKLMAKAEINGKIMFRGHEGISVLKSISFLNSLVRQNLISKKQMFEILYIVNYHSALWQYSQKRLQEFPQWLLNRLMQFRKLDLSANITEREIDEIPNIVSKIDNMQDKRKKGNPEAVVYVMVGVPRSGKSTIAKMLSSKYLLPVVSRDDILIQVLKEKTKNLNIEENSYNKLFSMAIEHDLHNDIDKKFREKINDFVKNRQSFIVDKTNVTRKVRNPYTHLSHYKKVAVVALTDLKETIKRGKDPNKYISQETILSFAKRLQLPMKGEFDEIQFIFGQEFEKDICRSI